MHYHFKLLYNKIYYYFRINEDFSVIQTIALTPPKNTKELVNLKKYIIEVKRDVIPELNERVDMMISYELFLSDYTLITNDELKHNGKIYYWLTFIDYVFEENTKLIIQITKELHKSLLKRISQFENALKQYSAEIATFQQFDDINLLSTYTAKVIHIDNQLNNALNTIDEINEEEKHFGWEESTYPLRKTVKLIIY